MFTNLPDLPQPIFWICQAMLAAALLMACWRVWRGPNIIDRVVALDLIAALMMAQFVILVLSSKFVSYLDVASAIAVISFLAAVAFARYLEDKDAPL